MTSQECFPCTSATWPLGLLARSSLASHALLLFGACFLIVLPGLDMLSRLAGYASLAGTTLAHSFYFTYFPDSRSVERFSRADPGAHPLTDFPDESFPLRPEAWLVLILAYHAANAALFLWAASEESHDAARAYLLAATAWHAASSLLAAWSALMVSLGMHTPATAYPRHRFRTRQCV